MKKRRSMDSEVYLGDLMKIYELIVKPTKFFRKKFSLKESLIWFAASDLVFSGLYVITRSFTRELGIIETFLAIYMFAWAMYIITSGLITLAAISLRAKSTKKIFTVFAYSCTTFLLFGWMPYISILALIWALSTTFIGISEVEHMSYERSSLAVSIGIFISVLVFLASLTY